MYGGTDIRTLRCHFNTYVNFLANYYHVADLKFGQHKLVYTTVHILLWYTNESITVRIRNPMHAS